IRADTAGWVLPGIERCLCANQYLGTRRHRASTGQSPDESGGENRRAVRFTGRDSDLSHTGGNRADGGGAARTNFDGPQCASSPGMVEYTARGHLVLDMEALAKLSP